MIYLFPIFCLLENLQNLVTLCKKKKTKVYVDMKLNINNSSKRLQKYFKIKKTNLKSGFDTESEHEPSFLAFQVY